MTTPSKHSVALLCCLILLWLLFPQKTAGTEVVIIGTTKVIYLAADSVAFESLTKRRFGKCKIEHSGRFFWVNKGFVSNAERHFDADKIIRQLIREDRSFDEVVAAYRKVMLPTMQREGPYLRKNAESIYDGLIRNGTPILQLYLVRSTVSVIEAGIVEFPVVNGKFKDEVVKCPSSDPVCLLTSSEPAMQQYIQSHNGEIASKASSGIPIDVIEHMMEIAHKIDPNFIGPPYSILEIGPFGGRWIRQNNCPNISPN